ncbi:putative lipoprotein LppK [Mycobacterium kubicae]|uniref:Lipoprotein LppK n=1 Tax=Mycobacterium kubicae TaxID=120959 RepID=A0AAX1J640_9MYCO|nr:hypothetical protein [Mycobacterium kubicae]MCV7093952.1 hypothetical protein [Mycobacterium kubicae]OBF16892.1 hypothetical protein A5725_24875 [Mycobacterium kubicae]OBK46470.1 hypothetical protein A5657_25730 [Mycobacterium kubicae]ORV95373.1 hypothetical protein AWC13_20750 [Mycobacterium kubicae]QNI12414.1 hypothetical protein GAN18_15395 [Mycobacterium kubicae]
MLMAALSVSACTHDAARKLAADGPTAPPATSSVVAGPPTAPLPGAEALTDVLSRLADPAVAGADKINLVEGATPETAAALDRFTTAVRDGGFLPMTFAANNVTWSDKNPSDVLATIVVTTAQPNNRQFTFPMEFTSYPGGWQLSRQTAEMLLALGNSRASSPPSPSPAPPPPPPEPAPPPTEPGPPG